MTYRKLTTVFLLFLTLFCLSACGGEDTLTGTWEAPIEVSVLGLDAEEDTTAEAVIRFTFPEEGAGSMEITFDGDFPPQQDSFLHTTKEDQLTLDFETAADQTYTFVLDGDTLTLDGRIHLDLTRVS